MIDEEDFITLDDKNYKSPIYPIDTRGEWEKIRDQYKAPYEFCCVYECGHHGVCEKCECDMYRELNGVAGFGAHI